MALGKCLKCDTITEMTQDHVIPQWFNKALLNFGLPKLQSALIEMVCQKCNSNKGGKLDFTDERVRNILKPFARHFVEEIRKHEEFNP